MRRPLPVTDGLFLMVEGRQIDQAGHTDDNVPVYVFGPQEEKFVDMSDNTRSSATYLQLVEK
ncbi:hypothetical protein [Exiguobacterium qingdaonense]|uniref:hypothetical protein n=1 Tax=Exiguobacterium qingdaonense TaxID=2751251 RepID=UPI001BE86C6E|nr:hypothetical protein [Exiguobacterium qingdaonense]